MLKKIILIAFLFELSVQISYSASIKYYKSTNNNLPSENLVSDNEYNEYTADLGAVEKYLFGRIYVTDSTKNRISRIERHLFRQTYTTFSLAQRMNNILANYTSDVPYNSALNHYDTDYYGNMSLKDRVINSLIGQPTGFTPQIYPSPYLNNRIAPSYMQGYYGNNNLRYHNMVRPVSTGAGIHILQ